jgi:hypothetical protein
MRLVCIRQFGGFLPGDDFPEEVPEGAAFDHTYFAVKQPDEDPTPTQRVKPQRKEDDE